MVFFLFIFQVYKIQILFRVLIIIFWLPKELRMNFPHWGPDESLSWVVASFRVLQVGGYFKYLKKLPFLPKTVLKSLKLQRQ